VNNAEFIKRASVVYERLVDEESRIIFNARMNLLRGEGRIEFWDRVKLDKKWYDQGAVFKEDEYLIFGAGRMGRYIKDVLSHVGKRAIGFIDNNPNLQGKMVEGICIYSLDEVKNMPAYTIIFSSREYEKEMNNQLAEKGITNHTLDEEQICIATGNQYFDFFRPKEREVFIDGGGYDGATSLDFIKWTNDNYKAIYIFEPDSHSTKKICEIMDKIRNITLIKKGLSDCKKILRFTNDGTGGSCFNEEGNVEVPVVSIDEVLKGNEATYIKMDVEGSELDALEGSKKTIIKYKPRLAICIYHKPLDFVELPLKILEFNSEYKFAMRHYCSNLCETVLYAF